jgi:CheY-specific phosphatase CheX
MNNQSDERLYKVAAQIFEDLGFLLPTPELEPGQLEAPVDATVNVSFDGPFAGNLSVALCGGLLPTLAANMLGTDDDLSPAQQYDSLGEIGNVICGNLLPSLVGSKQVFRVGAPQVVAGQAPAAAADQITLATTQIGLEEGRADLRLHVSPDAIAYIKEGPQ